MPARRASFALGGGPSPAHGRGGGFGEELAPSDLAAELPTLDGTTARVDCLVPSDDSWRLHLSVRPHFWRSVEGGERVAALGITAEDDLGGAYTHTLAGIRRDGGGEEAALEFRPRLDPRASRLTLRIRSRRREATVHIAAGGQRSSGASAR
ncbi:MAG TPA: hypothetical protein VFN50_10050 [Acidimicrobiales bacterium]|nr:hypothetical protein [Acidimicrobiales bacterium]